MQAFRETCERPSQHQDALLVRIFKQHAGVAHLRKYGVAVPAELDAAGARELLARLPLTTYADYRIAVEAALSAADGRSAGYQAAVAELTGTQPFAFWRTSGTTGGQKKLPASMVLLKEVMEGSRVISESMEAAFPRTPGALELHFRVALEAEQLANGVWVGEGGSVSSLQALRSNDPSMGALFARWAAPKEVLLSGDARTGYYLHWLCALARRGSVHSMAHSYASSLLLACNVLQEYWPHLLADLAAGTAGAAWGAGAPGQPTWVQSGVAGAGPPPLPSPPPEVSAAVEDWMKEGGGGPELAEELRLVFEAGVEGLLQRLLPNLRYVTCVTTGAMSKYLPHLRRLLAAVPVICTGYGCAEGVFALCSDLAEYHGLVTAAESEGTAGAAESGGTAAAAESRGTAAAAAQAPSTSMASGGSTGSDGLPPFAAWRRDKEGSESFVLAPNGVAYLEFIPYERAGEACPPTVSLAELKVGHVYEVVVTNLMPLFRYRVNDLVRCVGHYRNTPKVMVEGRAGQALSVDAEKTGELALVAAVAAAAGAEVPGGCAGLQEWAAREEVHAGGAAGGSGHYVVYWELVTGPRQYAGKLSTKLRGAGGAGAGGGVSGKGGGDVAGLAPGQLERCAQALERELEAASPDYGVYRRAGALGGVELKLVKGGAFEALRALALARGTSAPRYKPPVTLRRAEQVEVMEGAVVAAASCL